MTSKCTESRAYEEDGSRIYKWQRVLRAYILYRERNGTRGVDSVHLQRTLIMDIENDIIQSL